MKSKLSKCIKKQKYLDIAIKRISDIADIDGYAEAISIVRANLRKNNLFQSVEEIMVILELVKSGLRRFQKVKINKNMVNILLPEIKIIIELNKNNCFKESYTHLKTHKTAALLGFDWDAIGITSEFINNELQELKAVIKEVLFTDWRYFPCRTNTKPCAIIHGVLH